MRRLLIVLLLASSLPGCAVGVAFFAIGAATTAGVVEQFDPSLGVAKAENTANAAIVNTLGPPLDKAAHAFFCNKYAASSCAGK